ncbi:MAG: GyrI-like domain-containing protein [Anaerolineaceae bacterium]|nr:GyrI-like domain-containing protein [Anaerolineaceae bacterium]
MSGTLIKDVHVEKLAPMRVASLSVTSESPEQEAIDQLIAWARPLGQLNHPFRFFGYDNCQPHPNHKYTTWITIEPWVGRSGGIDIIDFPGGCYATLDCEGVEAIGPGWNELVGWLKDSNYTYGEQPSLEEHLDVLDGQQHFKLYLSITPSPLI